MNSTDRPILRMDGITKRFGATTALSGVSFACHRSEIHAVLGENGAGKSTLMKLIAGVLQPTEGRILVDEQPAVLRSPRVAARHGLICMFQELSLVPDLCVRENLLLGAPGSGLGWPKSAPLERGRAILDRIDGGHIGMSARVDDLTLAERQQVEIAKAMSRDPRLLLLDEATSALNASVVEKVFALVREDRDRGVGVLFISHRFHEIEAIADKISVFRNGEHVETFANGAYDYSQIIDKMVGRKIDQLFPPRPAANPNAEPVVEVAGFCWGDDIADISLTLRRGRITGLGGLDGQGQIALLHGLFGLLRGVTGSISIGAAAFNPRSPRAAKQPNVGIAFIPEDRKTEGLIQDQSIAENLALAALGVYGRDSANPAHYAASLETLELKHGGLDLPVSSLSGGNQQKVVLSKWLALKPRCLLLADPTRGIDVKTKTRIYRLLRRLADAGTAVLLLSTDYEELVHLCDETHILYDGRVVQTLDAETATAQRIIAASLNLARETRSARNGADHA